MLLAPRYAGATFPYPAPPDGTAPQDYAAYLRLPAGVRPNDFTGGTAWKLGSDTTGEPAIDANPAELFGVTGMSVDLAWQTTTGRPDVLIAVLDSGIIWNDIGDMQQLRRKVHLNRHELPLPQTAAGATKPDLDQPFHNPDAYDLNDDGVFDVSDYAADARVTDRNANGLLDPQDLILTFSDGTDGDANGYVDDIAGWNFLDNDNDPFDEVTYGHGTGEAEDSTAEADNGGDLGTCPNCMVLPIRVGDSFIADSNLFGEGVVFAVDSGAHVVQEALGAVNNTPLAKAAIDYAWNNDVPVIASAADEESFHHNVPGANRHTIVVNSVTRYGDLAGLVMTPHSYLYLNGCTNYGGNMAVAITSTSCSSEATGRGAGIAGLIISAALNAAEQGQLTPRRVDATGAVHPLSANEMQQLLTMTADDVDQSADRAVNFGIDLGVFKFSSIRHASQAGWDQYFGYGRANARHAVEAAAAAAIPPEAELASPDWWETLDPIRSPVVSVLGSAAALRSTGYDWELAYGCGVQPLDDTFTTIGGQTGVTAPIADSVLQAWSVVDAAAQCGFDPSATAASAVSGTPSPNATPDQFTVTLRLRVVDAGGRRAESRRTVYLHHDADLLPGFPQTILGSGEPSPVFANLRRRLRNKRADQAGKQHLLVPTTGGYVMALRPGGRALDVWPNHTDPLPLHLGSRGFATGALSGDYYESLGNGLAVGDLDGDGWQEVVGTTLAGKVYVWDRRGNCVPGFPVSTNPTFSNRTIRDRFNRLQPGIIGAPVLADLDGDGALEIVAGAMDRHLYVWRHDGTPQPGFPVLMIDRTQIAAIDPITNKVTPKTVGGQSVALQGTKIVSTPAIGPLRGDGKPVIVVTTNEEYRETPNFSSTGHQAGSLFISLGVFDRANGRVYAVPASGTLDPDTGSNPSGPYLPGWPAKLAVLRENLLPWIEGTPGSPALADVDGDGKLEVGIATVLGPAYLLKSDGTSFFGNGPDGLPLTFPSDKATFGPRTNTLDGPSFPALGSGSFARIDGTMTFLIPGGGLGSLLDTSAPAEQLAHDYHLLAWNALTRTMLPAYPRVVDDMQFLTNPTVADVDGDGRAEILAGSGGYLVHAFSPEGVEAAGWPKFTGGWLIASPTAGPFGSRSVVAATTREGKLFVWRTRGHTADRPWPRFHHDARNTGYYDGP